jgi:predicted heme/steroid binding protein
MDPERTVSQSELRRSTGERGTRMWVAVAGIVYDVTDCARWRQGLHEGQHFPGQELTHEFAEAPHGAEVLSHPCAQRVGRLQTERASPA